MMEILYNIHTKFKAQEMTVPVRWLSRQNYLPYKPSGQSLIPGLHGGRTTNSSLVSSDLMMQAVEHVCPPYIPNYNL